MPHNDQDVESNFYDVDDILAKSTGVSCLFNKNSPADFFTEMLGIRKTKQVEDKQFSSEVPLWLVDSVRSHCTISLPQTFTPGMISVLQADARSVNLARNEKYFYVLGIELCHLFKDDDQETATKLANCILNTLTQRVGSVVAKALHGEMKADKLDCQEEAIFETGKLCKLDIDDWLNCTSTVSRRKRKL
ncbi:unnamed protein product [Caenorhabditis auriculariae]|uniref:DNA replication complex GINS protein PSF3 n=1 Tax=Caenorhabditis auriculariae TaxID=2777116 RepID=A0A8S1GRH7_9PELO|nr:unnamed protein product [Caenorhabditis auriculariae]